jgi:CBS domain containing-hemolysin-like protein
VSPGVGLVVAALLVAGNGFFVGVEFALLAARQTQLEHRAETSSRARQALHASRRLPLMIAGCQFGITICSLGLGAVGEPAVAHLIEPLFELAHLPKGLVHAVGFGVALLLMSVAHMLLGEMVPKNVALAAPERAAVALAPPLLLFIGGFRPVIAMLTAAAAAVLRVFRVEVVPEGDTAMTRDQIAGLVDEARREGVLGRERHEHVTGALRFQQAEVGSVVLGRDEVVTVPPDVTAAQLEHLVATTGFSRFPVETPEGRWTGYLHLADALAVPTRSRNRPLSAASVRDLPTVPAAMPLHEAMALLQRCGAHLAQVHDTQLLIGAVMLEDVLEELVGEVHDEVTGRRG